MKNEERVIFVDRRRLEYLGFWDEKSVPYQLGTWNYDLKTDSSTIAVSCLLSQNYKFEFTEVFLFSYNETTGFTYTNNVDKLHNLTIDHIQKIAKLIMESEPALFSSARVKEDRIRQLFSAS